MAVPLVVRAVLAATATMLAAAGCGTLRSDAHLAAFSSQLTGMNQVPPVHTAGSARVVAVLDKNTRLFRWKMPTVSLTGAVTAVHFHGPARVGANADTILRFNPALNSPIGSQATLTPSQMSDLLSGKWYVKVHTSTHPTGEIRGHLMLRE